jgi:hypothetical protein
VKCPRCQTENREGLRFCEDCGFRLAVTCSACGVELTPGKKFCGACGASTSAPESATRFASPESYTPKHLAEKILTSNRALGSNAQASAVLSLMKGQVPDRRYNRSAARSHGAKGPDSRWSDLS